MLTIAEEMFILCLHIEKATVYPSLADDLTYGLNGALLAELALHGKIRVTEKHRIEVSDAAPAGDELLDQALEQIGASEQPRKVGYWVRQLHAKSAHVREQLTERLLNKHVLAQDEGRLAWIVPFPLHPELNASAKFAIKEHLRRLVLADGQAGLPEVALLSLLQACNMLDLVFTKDERKAAGQRVREVLVGMALQDPRGQNLEEIQMAVDALVVND